MSGVYKEDTRLRSISFLFLGVQDSKTFALHSSKTQKRASGNIVHKMKGFEKSMLETLPLEVLDLILDRLGLDEYGDSLAILDCFSIMDAVPRDTTLYSQIRSRFHLLSYVDDPSTRILNLLSGYQDNEKELNHENLIVAVDLDNWDIETVKIDLEELLHRCSEEHSMALHLLFPLTSTDKAYDVAKFYSVIKSVLSEIASSKLFNFESIIFDSISNKLVCDKNMFGILSYEFLETIESAHSDTFDISKVMLPLVTTLQVNYMTLDTFFYNILTKYKGYQRSKSKLVKNFLANFKFYMPNVVNLQFFKTNGCEQIETCNFIDVSSLILKKCKENKINVVQMFKIHSLANWKLPNIRKFTGHRFKFDEIATAGSPERLVVSLRENLKLLHDCAMSDTQDGVSYFRVNLIPEGVKKTKIINWVPTEISSNVFSKVEQYTTPIMCVRCESLEELELKLLRFEKSSTIEIQGLYFPNLKKLVLSNKPRITSRPVISHRNDSFSLESERKPAHGYTANLEVTRRRMLTTSNRYNKAHNTAYSNVTFAENPSQITDMNPIAFTSWNELPSCEFLGFVSEDSTNYIFNIQNLKEVLPILNLKNSFPTFVDEKQKFIVV